MNSNAAPRWAHRAALLTAAATFAMIVVGGLVTTTDSGDSVPGWTVRFWEWFQHPDRLPGGMLYEMGHRMIGTVVGFLTIGMAVLLWRADRRRVVRWLAVAAVAGVAAQGGLGGLRVRVVSDPQLQRTLLDLTGSGNDISGLLLGIKMIHATTAQAFFCLVVSLALVTSNGWTQSTDPKPSPGAASLRKTGRFAMLLLFLQLVLGAYVRHTHSSVGTLLHIGMAFCVLVAILLFAARTLSGSGAVPALRRPAYFLVGAVFVQVALGFFSWMLLAGSAGGTDAVVLRTAHVAVGALLFAATTVLTLRTYRLLKTEPVADGSVAPIGLKPGVQT